MAFSAVSLPNGLATIGNRGPQAIRLAQAGTRRRQFFLLRPRLSAPSAVLPAQSRASKVAALFAGLPSIKPDQTKSNLDLQPACRLLDSASASEHPRYVLSTWVTVLPSAWVASHPLYSLTYT